MRRLLIAALLLAAVMSSGCASPRVSLPDEIERPATAGEIARGREAATADLSNLASDVREEIGDDFTATVTVSSVGPLVRNPMSEEGNGPLDQAAAVEVVYAVDVCPKDDPTFSVRTYLDGHIRLDGDGGGWGDSGPSELSLARQLQDLPTEQRLPMVNYLASASLAATSTRDILAASLGTSWADGSGAEPAVQARLLAIVESRGRSPESCVWLSWTDASRGSEHSQLLTLDTRVGEWEILAKREGSSSAPVIAIK